LSSLLQPCLYLTSLLRYVTCMKYHWNFRT
jgi:hypothetical protein